MLAFRDIGEHTLWNCGEKKTRGGMYRDSLENKTEFIPGWGKRVVPQRGRGGGVKVLHLLKCASVKSTIWCSSSFNYLTRLQICHSVRVKRCHPYTFRNLPKAACVPTQTRCDGPARTGKLVNWNVSFSKGTAFPSSVNNVTV